MQNYAGKTWKELHKISNNDWSIPIKAIEHLILVNGLALLPHVNFNIL